MNWKLVFALSLFGLAMGLATVFVVPSRIEPAFWIVIFIVSALAIARTCRSRHFLHGLFAGIFNSVWITAAHVLLYGRYSISHPQEIAMMQSGPIAAPPRLMMVLGGLIVGVVSGCIIGLFAFIAGRLLKPRLALNA